MIFWEGLNISSAVGSTALPTPAAGGNAPDKSVLNHWVSACSLLDNTSRVQLFWAVIRGPAARFTVGVLDLASWPRSSSGNSIWTGSPLPLLLEEHGSASLLNDNSSQVNVMHVDMSDDNAQQHVCAESINYHPAHKPTGKIKLDKACRVNGNSMEGQLQRSRIC